LGSPESNGYPIYSEFLRAARGIRSFSYGNKIDIAPRDGRNAFENLEGVLVIGCKLVFIDPR